MAEQVSGYLTEDGTFFRDQYSAELQEAEQALDTAAGLHNVNPEKLRSLINAISPSIERYLAARKAYCTKIVSYNEFGQKSDPPSNDHEDDERPSENLASVFQQPPGVREPVPNVGGRKLPKAIRHDRESDGFGGRDSDA